MFLKHYTLEVHARPKQLKVSSVQVFWPRLAGLFKENKVFLGYLLPRLLTGLMIGRANSTKHYVF